MGPESYKTMWRRLCLLAYETILLFSQYKQMCFLSCAIAICVGRHNKLGRKTRIKCVNTHRLLYSWNDPPSNKRILANSTAFRNGTSTNSSKCNSTENLYFFFFIINAIPGAPGPINVIHNEFTVRLRGPTPNRFEKSVVRLQRALSRCTNLDLCLVLGGVFHVNCVGVLKFQFASALLFR